MTMTAQTVQARTQEMRATLTGDDLETAKGRYARLYGGAAFDDLFSKLRADPATEADGFIAWLDQLRVLAEVLRDKARAPSNGDSAQARSKHGRASR